MAELKSVVKDTAIYGLSSIIGRFLNYLLVPLYTAVLPASSGGYGIVTNIYAYVGLVLVILTFGMETTFFRFANKKEEHPLVVYSTTLLLVGMYPVLFIRHSGFSATDFGSHGLCFPSRIHWNHGCLCGIGCLFSHTFCLASFSEKSPQVCRFESAVHLFEHRHQPSLLSCLAQTLSALSGCSRHDL